MAASLGFIQSVKRKSAGSQLTVAMRSWYLRPGTVQEPKGKGTFVVGSDCQAAQ
jgi:hypothetical protein